MAVGLATGAILRVLADLGVALLDRLGDLSQFLLALLDFSGNLLVLLGCGAKLTLGVLKLLAGACELVRRVS